MGRVTKNMKRGQADQKDAGKHSCAYPMNNPIPAVTDLDKDLGFTDNSAHAIHSADKKKNKGISPTHD